MSNNDRHVINHTEDELYEHISKKYKNNHGEYDKSKIEQFDYDFNKHKREATRRRGEEFLVDKYNLEYKIPISIFEDKPIYDGKVFLDPFYQSEDGYTYIKLNENRLYSPGLHDDNMTSAYEKIQSELENKDLLSKSS